MFVVNKTPYAYNLLNGQVIVKGKAASSPLTGDTLSDLKEDKYFQELERAGKMVLVDAIPEEMKTPTQKLNEAGAEIARLQSELDNAKGGDYTSLQSDYKELQHSFEVMQKEAQDTITGLRLKISELEALLEEK